MRHFLLAKAMLAGCVMASASGRGLIAGRRPTLTLEACRARAALCAVAVPAIAATTDVDLAPAECAQVGPALGVGALATPLLVVDHRTPAPCPLHSSRCRRCSQPGPIALWTTAMPLEVRADSRTSASIRRRFAIAHCLPSRQGCLTSPCGLRARRSMTACRRGHRSGPCSVAHFSRAHPWRFSRAPKDVDDDRGI